MASDSGRVYCLDAPNSDAALQSLGQTRLKWVASLAGVANAITDLNAVLPSGSGWVLTSAVAVNDSGFIIGYGTRNGTTRPFLLAPQRNVN